MEEFERQKEEYTEEQVKQLRRTYEFRAMKRARGDKKENWNWQTEELKRAREEDKSPQRREGYELRPREGSSAKKWQ